MISIKKNNIAVQDNTRLNRPRVMPARIMKSDEARKREMDEHNTKAVVYDANKADYYRNMQNLYNQVAFGYGIFGNPTNYDVSNPEDQKKIESNFNYAKNNLKNFGVNLITTGIVSPFKGLLPSTTGRKTIGELEHLLPYKIGEGAEAVVINNSPTTVGKIAHTGSGLMLQRNAIPNTEPLKFVGYVRDGSHRFPTFIQKKMKVLTEETFPKYVDKLDKAMQKSGFKKIDSPDVQYRAYTDGSVVIDDIAPGNVGVNIFGKPKIIDFNLQTVPEWEAMGYSFKNGGKINIL